MLSDTIAGALCRRFEAFLHQSRSLCSGVSESEFWTKPYPYGNSIGHLLLHVTGNLNYYIGTQIAGTGYVRDRANEFTDTSRRPKAEVLADLASAVAMVQATIKAQSADDWSQAYSAVGTDESDRFSMVLRCTHHFHHHLGQIIYLVREHVERRPR
jgi:Protein of unknown function (DUF664)